MARSMQKGEAPFFFDVVPGNYVLVEMPSRWYLGKVTFRNTATAVLFPVLMVHSIGDTGLFMDGYVGTSTEVTPLPNPMEINLNCLDTAQLYSPENFARVARRTHGPNASDLQAARAEGYTGTGGFTGTLPQNDAGVLDGDEDEEDDDDD